MAAFLLVNAITVLGAITGAMAPAVALAGYPLAAAAMILAVVAGDGADGLLARRFGVSTAFGAQLDSLSDMCSFGVGAPLVAWSVADPDDHVALAGIAVLTACAAVRLARFAVSPRRTHTFAGLPTTAAGAVLSLAVLIDVQRLSWLMLALAVLMVSSMPYANLRGVLALPSWSVVLLLPLLSLPLATGVVIVVGAYLVSGPLLWLKRRHG